VTMPGKHEKVAAFRSDGQRGRSRDGRHKQVNALRAHQPVRRRLAERVLEKNIRPGAGCNEGQFGAHIEGGVGLTIANATTFDIVVTTQQRLAFDIVCDRCTVRVGIEQALERQTLGRIHLRVVILQRAVEFRSFEDRLLRQSRVAAQPGMVGQPLGWIGEPAFVEGQNIIEREPGLQDRATFPAAAITRHQKRQRMDEMGRDALPDAALLERFPNQSELEVALREKASSFAPELVKALQEDLDAAKKSPDEIVKEKNLIQISDETSIAQVCEQVIDENQGQFNEYLSGKDKLFGFFIGQAMKVSGGKLNPAKLNEIMKKIMAAKR